MVGEKCYSGRVANFVRGVLGLRASPNLSLGVVTPSLDIMSLDTQFAVETHNFVGAEAEDYFVVPAGKVRYVFAVHVYSDTANQLGVCYVLGSLSRFDIVRVPCTEVMTVTFPTPLMLSAGCKFVCVSVGNCNISITLQFKDVVV